MLTGDGSCGRLTLDGHLDPTCGCYEAGYTQGREKLELELEAWKPRIHEPGCECLPCRLYGLADMEEAERNLRRILPHPLDIDKQDLKNTLSVLLGLKVRKFVEVPGGRRSTYVLHTEGGGITFRTIDRLNSLTNSRNRIAEITGVMVPVVSPQVWHQCVRGLMLLREKETTTTWLHDYLTDRGVQDEEEWEKAAQVRLPFLRQAHICISLEDFGKWLAVNRGIKIRSSALGKPQLGRLGAKSQPLNVYIEGTRTTRNVWILPDTFQPPQRDDEDDPGEPG